MDVVVLTSLLMGNFGRIIGTFRFNKVYMLGLMNRQSRTDHI
jgi:hypothetical protein